MSGKLSLAKWGRNRRLKPAAHGRRKPTPHSGAALTRLTPADTVKKSGDGVPTALRHSRPTKQTSRGISSIGRASGWQPEGQGFESPILHFPECRVLRVPGPVVKGMRPGDQAWLNGRFLPRESLAVSVGDAGFVLGATVTEQLRTFRGELFLPGPHRDRLANSLAAVGIDPGLPLNDILTAAAAVARTNQAHVGDGDLGVVIFVTPGDQPSQHEAAAGQPVVAVHSFPLAFSLWAEAYAAGVSLRSVAVPQVPAACWPIHAKVRSRLHYYLADREAQAAEPGARSVVCHADGRVSETSTANIAIVQDGRIVSPPPADALPGVSLGFARTLSAVIGIDWAERSLAVADLAAADEILLTSTPSCILPATRFDGRPVGAGQPGAVYHQLLAAWNRAVGIDIAAQALTMARPF